MYIHIHICCTTSSARPTYWHVVQLVSTPIHHYDYTKNATRTFDDEKDLWNYVHVHDMYTYRLYRAGYLYPHVPNVQYMSIQYLEDYRPYYHHEI